MNIKKFSFPSYLWIFLLLAFICQSCIQDSCDLTYAYMIYTPVYMDPVAFDGAVRLESAQEINRPGKIYAYNDVIFVSDIARGVHIIDNSQPASPAKVAFINVPGTYDLNVVCDKLYLDSSSDLLVFDLSQPSSPQLLNRAKNVLPDITQYRGYVADPSKGVVIDWVAEEAIGEYGCDGEIPSTWQNNAIPANTLNTSATLNARGIIPSVNGQAGSTSRFASKDGYMYVVRPNSLLVYNISDCLAPTLINEHPLENWGGEAETIYLFENLMFIGATNGVSVYDIANTAQPSLLSRSFHAQGCDPVVYDGSYAYVTLHTDHDDLSPCTGWTNQLEVWNMADPANPIFVNTFFMTSPRGLGVDRDLLFIADGPSGLRIFDNSNPTDVGNQQIYQFQDLFATDVIPYDGTLIAVGENGISQYEYSNPSNIRLISQLGLK